MLEFILSICIGDKCVNCHKTRWTINRNSYMIKFDGNGKWNNRTLCLECFKDKMLKS